MRTDKSHRVFACISPLQIRAAVRNTLLKREIALERSDAVNRLLTVESSSLYSTNVFLSAGYAADVRPRSRGPEFRVSEERSHISCAQRNCVENGTSLGTERIDALT